MPERRLRIDKSIPHETQQHFYDVAEWDHRSMNGEIIHLFEQRRREIHREQTKAAEAAGALVIPASEEEWFTWLREKARQRGIPEADLLGKCMASYLEGLMFRQIEREKVSP